MIGNRKNTGSDLRKVDNHRIADVEYVDAPELTDEQLAHAVVSTGVARGRGRPKAEKTKVSVTLRLDGDIVEAYKATGEGWQTRINDTLRLSLFPTLTGKSEGVYTMTTTLREPERPFLWRFKLGADGKPVAIEIRDDGWNEAKRFFVAKRLEDRGAKKRAPRKAASKERTKHA